MNPVSFGRRADMNIVARNAREGFAALGVRDFRIYVSRFPRDAIGEIRRYAAEASEQNLRVYAVGGDGILFDCLNGVVGLDRVELAVIPYGNSNDFVRAFGEGKENSFRDIRAQITARSIPTDVIFCGSNYALNTCTIGLESYAAYKASELNTQYMPYRNKLPAPMRKKVYDFMFFWGGVIAAFTSKVVIQKYTISIDGKDFSGSYAGINIANGPCYGGDKYAAIAAVPDDGQLDALLFRSANTLNVLRIGLKYVYGEYSKFPDRILYRKASEITVRSSEPLVLQLDGELFFDTNITIKIVPSAVKIVAVGDLTYERRAALR